MAYNRTSWVANTSVITAERMNHIEDGLEDHDSRLSDAEEVLGNVLDSVTETWMQVAVLTQDEYDALESKDSGTLYLIKEDSA
ncbi:MAG: hypothetical protein LUD69_07295 [Oscillospiraceae bacterium]|nr:hypothetical protein [Oscillospiraceae bacterium]